MINLNPVKAVVFQGPKRGRGRPRLGHVLFAHKVTKEKFVELDECLKGSSEVTRLRAEIDALKQQNYQLVEEVEYLKGVAGVSAKG